MKLNLITLFLCCFSLASLWSQSKISGTVTDKSKIPLLGVNVIIKGTSSGVVTDFDGNFIINVEKGKTLIFSYIGYSEKEIIVGDQKKINVTLADDTSELDEVIIVGYGSQKKESVLGAISQVKGVDILNSGTTNIVNSLSSLSAGVNIVQSSGQPGQDSGEIFIRGKEDVLVLVDGVEVLGGISYIDPNDIENVSILKDGAATAVYGIRGANGVVIVTTKRGKIGPPKVSFTSQVSAKFSNDQYDELNAYQAEQLYNIGAYNDNLFDQGYSSQTDLEHFKNQDLPYLYPDTNWQDYVFKDFVVNTNHSVNIRGGNEFVKYFASSSFLQQNDITTTEQFFNYDPKHRLVRYSSRANLDFKITETTTFKTSVSNRLENVNTSGQNSTAGSFLNLYTIAPGSGVPFYPAEALDLYPDPLYPGLSEVRHPTNRTVGVDRNGATNINRTIFNIDFELEQDLKFITPGLKFSGKYNFVSNNETQNKTSFDTSSGEIDRLDTYTLQRDGTWLSFEGPLYERPFDFTLSNESITKTSEIEYYKAQFDYDRSFGKHNVTGLGVFSRNRRISGVDFPFYEEVWVARGTYDYDKRFFFEVSGSYNGDESFTKGNRFQLFPSYSVGVNLAKENFFKKAFPAVNNFKIRYSNGQTGTKNGLKKPNTNPSEFHRWQYISEFDRSTPTFTRRFIFGEEFTRLGESIITETQIGNENLTWATVTKQNLGLEFGLFKNKFSGELEFFKDRREGEIARLQNVPEYFGTTASLPFTNIQTSESHGMELTLTLKDDFDSGFRYSITGIYGFNENRILVSAADQVGTPSYTRVAGKPAGTTAALQTDGFFQNIDEVVNYPDYTGIGLGDFRYVDFNADGKVLGTDTDDQIRFDLPRSPKHSFSLKLNTGYKAWSLNAVIGGIVGHKGLLGRTSSNNLSNLLYALPEGVAAGRTEQLDYWTPTNTDAEFPALHISKTNPNLTANTTDGIVNLDYIKLRSMNIGYEFDMSNNKSISLLKVYLNGSNLLTFSDLGYANPEGKNPGALPVLPEITLGVNLNF